MNDLFVTTNPTLDQRVFDTYWMTGLEKKGRIRITVPNLTDGRTAAELAATQYLLEAKNACGHNKAGAGLRIRFSCSAIRDLLNGDAPKGFLAPYAKFLRTRFRGCEVTIEEHPFLWADERCEAQVDFVEIENPPVPTIEVAGIGTVELTAHAVDRYIERAGRPPEKAWRDLVQMARKVKPVKKLGRSVFNDIKHRRPGQYMFHEQRNLLLVVAEPDHLGGLPRLVSVQVPTENARLVALT